MAGLVPWWVLLETTGRRTGLPRRTPVATGLSEPAGMWLNAVHGNAADWVKNIGVQPRVRVRVRGRWRTGLATLHPVDTRRAPSFNVYARSGPRLFGLSPALVFVRWDPGNPSQGEPSPHTSPER